MKVRITERKAPWPAGAKVGNVVSFGGDAMPAWAAGKCTVVPDDAAVDFHYELKAVTGDGAGQALPPAHAEAAQARASLAAGEEQARQEREAAIQRAFEELRAERDQAVQQHEAVQAALAAALDREVSLQQQLDAALAAAAAATRAPAVNTREALNAEAEKLGIKVDGRWSDERLTEEIAKAGKK